MLSLSGNIIGKGNWWFMLSSACFLLGRSWSRESFNLIWMFHHKQRHVAKRTPEATKTRSQKQLKRGKRNQNHRNKLNRHRYWELTVNRLTWVLFRLFNRRASRMWTHLLCVPLCDFICLAVGLQIVSDWACWKVTMHAQWLFIT